jgi:hypothetical protein
MKLAGMQCTAYENGFLGQYFSSEDISQKI